MCYYAQDSGKAMTPARESPVPTWVWGSRAMWRDYVPLRRP